MTERRSRRLLRDEAGMTLPEVIVYIVISMIVLAGLVGMFASGLATHANTKNRDTATGTVGVAVNSLQTSIRNASAFDIDANTLRARVAVGDGTDWQCRAWALSGGTLYFKAASSAIPTPADYEVEGWTALANGVTGTLGPSNALVPFLESGTQLLYGFEVVVGDAGTGVALEGGAVPQAAPAGSPTCW